MKDLNKLAKFARKNGITSLRIDGIEMQIHPAYMTDNVRTKEEVPEAPLTPQYTDEQILNWSSTTYFEAN